MDNFWKNKTVIAYIALAHHTRFLLPVMDQLSAQGARIKYIVGQAERSQEITAIEKNLKYSHIFDFVSEKDNAAVDENYQALRNTFSKSLKNDFLLGLSLVTVTDKTLYSTAMEYVGFKNLFLDERPDLCFALHELNRWGKMFSFWAKKNNVPFVTLQEGLGYNLDFGYTGHAQYSCLNLVWGQRIKKKFASYEVPEDKIILTGNIHLAKELRDQQKNNIRQIKRKEYHLTDCFVSLLVLSSLLPPPGLYHALFNTISKNRHLKLIIKFHPACRRQQMDLWKESIAKELRENLIFVHARESVYDLISMSDLCVLDQPSTTGLEALAFDKPLVKMNFGQAPTTPYSFEDQGVAVEMTVEELSDALVKGIDFSGLIDPEKKDAFLTNELFDTDNAINNVCSVFKTVISASRETPFYPVPGGAPAEKKWSVILPVPDDEKQFLIQLEALINNSEGQGEYETIFLEPQNLSDQILEILDSLKGEFKRIPIKNNEPLASAMNQAGQEAAGETLLFLGKGLAPLAGWLDHLQQALDRHGGQKVYGARICDSQGRLVNSGTVVDQNNSPVSAYAYLNAEFEGAQKERLFQMTDHFAALNKDFFSEIGGFTPQAGPRKFMDLCLKAAAFSGQPESVVYLPGLRMIMLETPGEKATPDEAIYFYGKWHGVLWESESRLLKADGISLADIANAKLSKAMQAMQ